MAKSASPKANSPSQLIDARIEALGDWRGQRLAQLRAVIKAADPDIVEEWKWGIPVWSHDGIVCTGETYKSYVKTTFAQGAALKDPAKLFNSSMTGGTRRAIDFRENDKMNEKALATLVRDAAALNTAKTEARGAKPKAAVKPKATAKAPAKSKAAAKPSAKTKAAPKTKAKTASKR